MECSPVLSVILLTPDDLATVSETIGHLRKQTIRKRIELLIVTPNASDVIASDVAGEFFSVRALHLPEAQVSVGNAYAVGVRNAHAALVALCEDHSFPAHDWAERLVAAHHRDQVAVVGPQICNANPESVVSWSNLIIEYGEWVARDKPQDLQHLPGHNSCYRREVLLQLGDALDQFLQAESLLHWHLRSSGHRLLLEPAAHTYHLNFAKLSDSLRLRFWAGRSFAAHRSVRWPWPRKLLYAVAWPFIPLVRFRRMIPIIRRVRSRHRLSPIAPLLMWFLLGFDALGEGVGYLRGEGSAGAYLWDIEFQRRRFT